MGKRKAQEPSEDIVASGKALSLVRTIPCLNRLISHNNSYLLSYTNNFPVALSSLSLFTRLPSGWVYQI
jgi:hypothetical protein